MVLFGDWIGKFVEIEAALAPATCFPEGAWNSTPSYPSSLRIFIFSSGDFPSLHIPYFTERRIPDPFFDDPWWSAKREVVAAAEVARKDLRFIGAG